MFQRCTTNAYFNDSSNFNNLIKVENSYFTNN